MKNILTLASVLLLSLVSLAFTVETGASVLDSSPEPLVQLMPTTSLTEGVSELPIFMLSLDAQWGTLPDCYAIEGTSCSGPGGPLVRCYNYQYCEPMVCPCQANLTRTCA